MENVNYQIIENRCEAALIDFNYHEETSSWLLEHKSFFDENLFHINTVVSNRESVGYNYPNIIKFYFSYTKMNENR